MFNKAIYQVVAVVLLLAANSLRADSATSIDLNHSKKEFESVNWMISQLEKNSNNEGLIADTNVTIDILLKSEQRMRVESKSSDDLGECLSELGHAYLNYIPHTSLAAFEKPIALFREVAGMNVNHFLKADAYRMLGQTLLYNTRNPKAALKTYEQLERLVEDSKDPVVKKFFESEVLSKMGYAQQLVGNVTNSIATREQLLQDKDAPELERINAIIEVARSYTKIGNSAKAVEFYDRLFKEYPNYGKSDGSIISLRYERIKAFAYDDEDERNLKLIEALWNDEATQVDPLYYIIGTHVANCYKVATNHSGYIATLNKLKVHLETRGTNYSTREWEKYSLNQILQDSLLALGDAYAKNGDNQQSLKVFEEYLTRFPKGGAASYAKGAISDLNTWKSRKYEHITSRVTRVLLVAVFVSSLGILIFSMRRKTFK